MKKSMLIFLAILVVLFLGVSGIYDIKSKSVTKTFTYSEEAIANPLMGYAPAATTETVTDDITLLYVDITWQELEPEEGVYDWETIETKNQFTKWKNEGKHLVLRFVLDYPSDESHLDIPEWLYRQLDDPGDWYTSAYGQGFSPNYDSEDLINAYEKAVQAMGNHWGDSEFISFIELGVLGHWGEWHVDNTAGIRQLPEAAVREKYVTPWLSAFPNANLLMRRPFAIASENHLGLYNDMAGNLEATQEWLDWIDSGGVYSQTGEDDLVAMPEVWQTAPIGGELTSSDSMTSLLQDNLAQTISLIADSHMTFLGPKIAEDVGDDKAGYETLLKNMGYRLWVTSVTIKEKTSHQLTLTLTLKNSGVAPFYRNWKSYLYLKNKNDDSIQTIALDLDLTKIFPDEEQSVAVTLPIESLRKLENDYSVTLGVIDPQTNQDAIHFAVSGQEENNMLVLFDN